jgi:hypothetical protein
MQYDGLPCDKCGDVTDHGSNSPIDPPNIQSEDGDMTAVEEAKAKLENALMTALWPGLNRANYNSGLARVYVVDVRDAISALIDAKLAALTTEGLGDPEKEGDMESETRYFVTRHFKYAVGAEMHEHRDYLVGVRYPVIGQGPYCGPNPETVTWVSKPEDASSWSDARSADVVAKATRDTKAIVDRRTVMTSKKETRDEGKETRDADCTACDTRGDGSVEEAACVGTAGAGEVARGRSVPTRARGDRHGCAGVDR